MSDTSSEPDSPEAPKELPFAGIVFHIYGQWAGWTQSKVTRYLEQNGGKVSKNIENPSISHIILSEQLWSRQGTASADPIIKCMIKANEENRTEVDEDHNRVWLLPLEWMVQSAELGFRLPERMHDLERTQDAVRHQRQVELAEERRRNKGHSRFGRGERRVWEREQAMKAELARMDKLTAMGAGDADADAFTGLPQLGLPSGMSLLRCYIDAEKKLTADDAVAPAFSPSAAKPDSALDLGDHSFSSAVESSPLDSYIPTIGGWVDDKMNQAQKASSSEPVSLAIKGAAKAQSENLARNDQSTAATNVKEEKSKVKKRAVTDSESDDIDPSPQPKLTVSAQTKKPAVDQATTKSTQQRKVETAKVEKTDVEAKEKKPAQETLLRKADKAFAAASAAKGKKEEDALKPASVKDVRKPGSSSAFKKGEKAKPARDLAVDKIKTKPCELPKGSTATAEKSVPPAIKSPSGTKSFAEIRKPTGGMFAGGPRGMPEAGSSKKKESSVVGETKQAKRARLSAAATIEISDDSSDDEPLARKVKKVTRSQQDKTAKRKDKTSTEEKEASPPKPAFRIDANGKKRPRFLGDGSDDDASGPLRRLKKKQKSAEEKDPSSARAKASSTHMVISDSE
ncbi:hypothetical protein JCM10908_004114 [Rhodotorula pacifica]|uniref:BRCT domain-containing protein n=1 Tax=Rhodotorula pacifica TaxID=1495444 RepID=UPI0031751792